MHSHWRLRVAERISPDVDADILAKVIIQSIKADDGLVRFKRKQRGTRRIYQFDYFGERRYVVIDLGNPNDPQPVTVLPRTAAPVGPKANKGFKPLASPGWRKGKGGQRKRREGKPRECW